MQTLDNRGREQKALKMEGSKFRVPHKDCVLNSSLCSSVFAFCTCSGTYLIYLHFYADCSLSHISLRLIAQLMLSAANLTGKTV